MFSTDLPYRQIHLDFHTSEKILAVGDGFDPEEFAATLDRARVGSVTCFARCHHGWMYYDSKLHPDRVHPGLADRSLLRRQVEACHRRGIRAPVYTSVQWDHQTAEARPEWVCVAPDGRPAAMVESMPYQAGFYRYLCVNSPYRDYLKGHVREILETLSTDGLFLDIVWAVDCSCRHCRVGMARAGVDSADPAARKAFASRTVVDFTGDMTAFIRRFNRDCSIYYNNAQIGPNSRGALGAQTHLEFDALPGEAPGGYLNFPRKARFERNLGKQCVGMTGKFHRGWGDIHSFKNPAALEFECFQLLALNARCMIGDQLDPTGRIDPHTYDLVGSVYSQVEKKEPWCAGAKAVADVGVMTAAEGSVGEVVAGGAAGVGVTRILQEGAHQFDMLDWESDLSPYKVLVLPDRITLSPGAAAKVSAYLAGGGKVLASLESGMDEAKKAFALKELAVSLLGDGPLDAAGAPVRGRVAGWKQADHVDYIVPTGPLAAGLPQTEHAMYTQCADVAAAAGAEVLAPVTLSHFHRSHEHFSSHMHAPTSRKPGGAAVVRTSNTVYFAHGVFELYHHFAARWYKRLVLNALGLLLPDPVLRHDGPSTVIATVNEQADRGRWVVHLLHYIPERRATYLDVVEDVIPLYGLRVTVRPNQRVRAVTAEPQGEAIPFDAADGAVRFVLPKLDGHQMVSLQLS